MKSFTDLFIKRPVLAMVVSFVILIAGLQALKTINVRQYPRTDIASIQITTVYVGADAELVRGFITTPLERAIAAADGIDYIQSQSQQSLSTITALHTADQFKQLVVKQDKGTLVRLGDIADVVLGAEDYNTEVRFSGQKAVFMGIWVLPNANSVDVIKRVRAEMDQIKKELPTGMTGEIAYDATAYINDAIHEVVETLIDTLLIVMVVIFLFLGSFRSVVVPIVAIPISLIGALFLMQAFGFTLNLLTLLAIVLSVGLVVDDAIVVVENVERHVREGMKPVEAAIVGARELVTPIVAMTITLAAVYVPIGLQGGLIGALFREFALTLAGAVFISGVVALVLSPMMSANLLRAEHSDHGFSGFVNRTFDRFRDWYGSHLDRTLNARPAVYLVWAGV